MSLTQGFPNTFSATQQTQEVLKNTDNETKKIYTDINNFMGASGHAHTGSGSDGAKITASNLLNVAAGTITATDQQAVNNELDTNKAPKSSPSFKMATNSNIRFIDSSGTPAIEAVNDAVNANVPLKLTGSQISLMGGNVGIGKTPTTILDVAPSTLNTHNVIIGSNVFYNAGDNRPSGVATQRRALSLYFGGTSNYSYGQQLSVYGTAVGLTGDPSDKNHGRFYFSASSDVDSHATKTDIMTLSGSGAVGIGTDPRVTFHSTGSTILGVTKTASWTDISNSQMHVTVDEPSNTLAFYIKLSNGDQKIVKINYNTGAIALS